MSYSYKCYSDTKDFMKKFVNAEEAKGNTILINLEVFDEYMEQFREPPTEMKHPLPNVKGD